MGQAGMGLVGDRSVGNGSVTKKVAADPPSFNWFRSHLEFPELGEALSLAAIVMKIKKVMRKMRDS
jgi:hypothetical protein